MTLKEELNLFLEEYNTRYTSPEAIIALSKTFQSHNITIEDWNSLVKFLESNDISINKLYEFITKIVNKVDELEDDILDLRLYTDAELLKKVSIIYDGIDDMSMEDLFKIAGGSIFASGLAYSVEKEALIKTKHYTIPNPMRPGTVLHRRNIYVYPLGENYYLRELVNTTDIYNEISFTKIDILPKLFGKYLFIPDDVSIESYFKSYTAIGDIPTAGDLEDFEPDTVHTFTLKFIPTSIGSNESGFYTLVDPDVAFKLLNEDLGYTPNGITNNVMAVYTPTKYTPYGPSTLIIFKSASGKFWSFLGDL